MTGAQLARWFDAFSRTAPGNANHALALLRQIMNFAVACGYIEKNPTQGIRPNRRLRLTRFLSREEITRLHRVLDAQTGENNRQQADIIGDYIRCSPAPGYFGRGVQRMSTGRVSALAMSSGVVPSGKVISSSLSALVG